MLRTIFCFWTGQSSIYFAAQTTYSTDSGPQSVAVADVNGDNKPDIIVANSGSNNVGVFLSLGEPGNFAG